MFVGSPVGRGSKHLGPGGIFTHAYTNPPRLHQLTNPPLPISSYSWIINHHVADGGRARARARTHTHTHHHQQHPSIHPPSPVMNQSCSSILLPYARWIIMLQMVVVIAGVFGTFSETHPAREWFTVCAVLCVYVRLSFA